MDRDLLFELLKSKDNLQTIEFTIKDKNFKFYFRYLTLLEKVRIEQMCVKPIYTMNDDGSQTVEHKQQKHLLPIYTILEKALDKNGKRLFSHTDNKDFKLISDLPANVATYIAYQMNLDITGTLGEDNG